MTDHNPYATPKSQVDSAVPRPKGFRLLYQLLGTGFLFILAIIYVLPLLVNGATVPSLIFSILLGVLTTAIQGKYMWSGKTKRMPWWLVILIFFSFLVIVLMLVLSGTTQSLFITSMYYSTVLFIQISGTIWSERRHGAKIYSKGFTYIFFYEDGAQTA